MAQYVLLDEYGAVGGPPMSSRARDGIETGPTDPGEYRVSHCGRHVSTRYPFFGSIPWGTPLKEEHGELFVKMSGSWRHLSDFSRATREDVLNRYEDLYNVRKVPSTWVFNDFGHQTCYLYKDQNNNRRRDANEAIHGEFFHTTPDNEAQAALHRPVQLTTSHGCIHLNARRHRPHDQAWLPTPEHTRDRAPVLPQGP